jgi:hypothetical protein
LSIRDTPGVARLEGVDMTTIAYKDGTLASDSRVSIEPAAGEPGATRIYSAAKLFRKTIQPTKRKALSGGGWRSINDGPAYDVVIGLAGEAAPGLVFLDWYGSGDPEPESINGAESTADFTALILSPAGLFEADGYCRPEQVLDDCYAVGTGAHAAMGAMRAGKTAEEAVAIAVTIDIYSALPLQVMKL